MKRNLARLILVAAVIACSVTAVVVIPVTTVYADAAQIAEQREDDAQLPDDNVPATEICCMTDDETHEAFENEYIESALLARAHVIEDVTVTHYDCCVQCCGKDDGITASGVRATPGVTVAVDPTVIPLGADVLVDYGDGEIHYYRADDVGGAIKGNHIDLCVSDHQTAALLGVRTATVYWVESDHA